MAETKIQLFNECSRIVDDRITRLESEMTALKNSAESDTKSSMGDKYETGREMINLEKGKIAEQLVEASKMKQTLNSLDLAKAYKTCELGSLVSTESGAYFLATSLGKVDIADSQFFVISPISPIGQQLLGKSAGDQISFGGRLSSIKRIE